MTVNGKEITIKRAGREQNKGGARVGRRWGKGLRNGGAKVVQRFGNGGGGGQRWGNDGDKRWEQRCVQRLGNDGGNAVNNAAPK